MGAGLYIAIDVCSWWMWECQVVGRACNTSSFASAFCATATFCELPGVLFTRVASCTARSLVGVPAAHCRHSSALHPSCRQPHSSQALWERSVSPSLLLPCKVIHHRPPTMRPLPTAGTSQVLLRTFAPRSRQHHQIRSFSRTYKHRQQHRKSSFSSRLRDAWNSTPVVWKPIPIGLGVVFLGAFQLYRINERERRRIEESTEDDPGDVGKPKRRERIRPSGPWTVQIMSTIPLRALSRWWGWMNSIDIPYYL